MIAARAAPSFTEKEYLALEGVAETKHELSAGSIVAMAGAELAHNVVAQNVKVALSAALAGRPCVVVGSDQRVRVDATRDYFYPDAVVTCLEPKLVDPRPQSLVNPQVIVEVLSASTESYDRSDKWLAYRTIPTLTDYILIASDRREIEHHVRGSDSSWTSRTLFRSGTISLAHGPVLDMEDLYRLVPGIPS